MTGAQDPFARGGMDKWESRFDKNSRDDTLSNQRIAPGETVAVFIIAGQSLAANVNGVVGDPAYVPVYPSRCDMLNIDDGAIYAAKEPMLGCETAGGGKSIFVRVADKLIAAGYRQRVILINVAIGGTSSDVWKNDLYQRIVIANERAKAKGLTVNAVLWQQGEADNFYSVNQTTYAANMTSVINSVRAKGVSAPWILAKSTKTANSDSAAIRAAVDQLANGVDIFVGPDNDSLTGGNRIADGTHMTAPVGCDNAAILWRNSIQAILP